MTAEEAFDFLADRGYADPAAVCFGEDLHILGYWLPISHVQEGIILKGDTMGVQVLGEGSSWDIAMRATGLWKEFAAWKTKRVSK